MVDYCIVPYESINMFEKFEVFTISELIEKHNLLEYADPNVSKPDHSLLVWNINIEKTKNETKDLYQNFGGLSNSFLKVRFI